MRVFSAIRSIKSDLLSASVVIYDLLSYQATLTLADNNLFKYKTVAQYTNTTLPFTVFV